MKSNFTATWCRYLHLGWILLLFLLQSNSIKAQSVSTPIKDSANYYRQLLHCGTTPAYLSTLAVNPPPTGSNNFTSVANFPSYAIVDCGKFRIYYEDLITGNPQGGFSDPAWGSIRRSTLCSVLTYIQSVFDFSNVDPNNPIRLYVDTSYSAAHPAPTGTSFYAQAGPLYNAAASGQINGYVNDYVTTGIDPANNGDYHASLHVNFDAAYYQDLVTTDKSICEYAYTLSELKGAAAALVPVLIVVGSWQTYLDTSLSISSSLSVFATTFFSN